MKIPDIMPTAIPIVRDHLGKIETWKVDCQKVPEPSLVAKRAGWTDRFLCSPFYAGVRRGAKITLHLAGLTLVNAAILKARGHDTTSALLGGTGMTIVEAPVTLGIDKAIVEKAKVNGKGTVEIVDVILFAIYSLVKAVVELRAKKKGGQ